MSIRSAAAGNKYSFLSFLDTENYAIGGTPSAPAAGDVSNWYRLQGIKAVPINKPDDEIVTVTGDDGLIAEFSFDSIENRAYVATMAVDDLTLQAYLQNSVTATVAGAQMGVGDTADAPVIPVSLIHQSRAVKKDASNGGQKAWNGIVVPVATATYLGREGFDERSPAVFRIQITPQLATNLPWGDTLFDRFNVNAARVQPFRSDYPFAAASFTGDGTQTTFSVDYTPVDVAHVGAWVFRSSVSVLSVSTVNKTITLSAAPANGRKGVLLYQFNG
jgi:hypothetical protein